MIIRAVWDPTSDRTKGRGERHLVVCKIYVTAHHPTFPRQRRDFFPTEDTQSGNIILTMPRGGSLWTVPQGYFPLESGSRLHPHGQVNLCFGFFTQNYRISFTHIFFKVLVHMRLLSLIISCSSLQFVGPAG